MFTARYELGLQIKQSGFVFKSLRSGCEGLLAAAITRRTEYIQFTVSKQGMYKECENSGSRQFTLVKA